MRAVLLTQTMMEDDNKLYSDLDAELTEMRQSLDEAAMEEEAAEVSDDDKDNVEDPPPSHTVGRRARGNAGSDLGVTHRAKKKPKIK